MANTKRKSEWVCVHNCRFWRNECWFVFFFLRGYLSKNEESVYIFGYMHEFTCCARRCHENKRHDERTLSEQWNPNEWVKPHLWMTYEPDIRFGGSEHCHGCDFSSKSTYTHTHTCKYMYSNVHSRILVISAVGDPHQHVGLHTQSLCMWAVFFQRTASSSHLVVPHLS